jgi:elongation factor Ts
MSTITASAVKELREKTGVGMMDCKKALQQTNGDFEEAIKYLREKGLSAASKKADREALEGRISTAIDASGKFGVIVEVNCETDFVAKNDSFVSFTDDLAQALLKAEDIKSVEDLTRLTVNGKSVQDVVSETVLKVGENVRVKNLDSIKTEGCLASYIHMNGKIGVLVEFSAEVDDQVGRDIAMQIAAVNPSYITRDQVPSLDTENEANIIRTQALNEGKPEKIIDRLVEGKLNKYYKEICLIEQVFVKDQEKTINQVLPSGVTVNSFKRYAL